MKIPPKPIKNRGPQSESNDSPPETSPRLSRIHAEHLRNPIKSYADPIRN